MSSIDIVRSFRLEAHSHVAVVRTFIALLTSLINLTLAGCGLELRRLTEARLPLECTIYFDFS